MGFQHSQRLSVILPLFLAWSWHAGFHSMQPTNINAKKVCVLLYFSTDNSKEKLPSFLIINTCCKLCGKLSWGLLFKKCTNNCKDCTSTEYVKPCASFFQFKKLQTKCMYALCKKYPGFIIKKKSRKDTLRIFFLTWYHCIALQYRIWVTSVT